ncbi:hypothetical protein Smp_040990 [Schistosoma mansoni]|nr:hypothetical protein Smp_040990 [Schistosoma mansoni]|eukprot:XP_018648871.1 hypothetical protein Smp_040990 [Schistosoma mansoni]
MIAHWMPCKIEANGMKVNSELQCSETLNDEPGALSNHVLLSNFRGRPLRGVQLSFPNNYSPVVVHHSSVVSDVGTEPIKFGAKLDKIILWNLSTPPRFSDPIPLSLTWLHLASILHSSS